MRSDWGRYRRTWLIISGTVFLVNTYFIFTWVHYTYFDSPSLHVILYSTGNYRLFGLKKALELRFKADELREKLRDLKIENSRELIEAAADIILMIAKASGDPVEKDWLLENATVEQILEFVAVATLGPDYRKTGKKKEPAKDSDEST